jgi:hypothetical protein
MTPAGEGPRAESIRCSGLQTRGQCEACNDVVRGGSKRVKMLQSLCLVVWRRLLETTVLQGSRLKSKRWKSLSGGVTWHLYFLMQPNEPGRCGRHESD